MATRGDNSLEFEAEVSSSPVAASPKASERMERIAASADTIEALTHFQDLYEATCSDFEQPAEPTIVKQVRMMIEREIPCDLLMLSGRRVGVRENNIYFLSGLDVKGS